MPMQPNEDVSGERKQRLHLRAVGSTVTKAPQEAASIVSKASRVTYRYTGRTVRKLRKADLRFHTKPAELAKEITGSAQATISDLAGTTAARIEDGGTTAADKGRELAGTAASEIGNAMGMAVGGLWSTAGPSGRSAGNPSKHSTPVRGKSETTPRSGQLQPRRQPGDLS